jgi:integrase
MSTRLDGYCALFGPVFVPKLCPSFWAEMESTMATRLIFTPTLLDALCQGRPGTVRRLEDPQTPGLTIEVQNSGLKSWRYRRRVRGADKIVKMTLGSYPAYSIADARKWARELNDQVETGIDPREETRKEEAYHAMTVERAHGLYMEAVREGRSSRAKRPNRPRTITDKLKIFKLDVKPALGRKIIYEVSEKDLILLVEAKGKTAKVRANRLAAELKVFFGWAASLRGLAVGLEVDPSRRLADLRFPEVPRSRRLSLDEITWFLQALVEERDDFRRGMLLWLLTAVRFSELIFAKPEEIVDGVWTIGVDRAKNGFEHRIALAPWGRALMQAEGEWVFPAEKVKGPRTQGWYEARDRVQARMEERAGRPIERFTPHDFRRTARSNTKRLKVDYETAETMMNHVKKGLSRTYDLYELEDEKRTWFALWEKEIVALAIKGGAAKALGVPASYLTPAVTSEDKDAVEPVAETKSA